MLRRLPGTDQTSARAAVPARLGNVAPAPCATSPRDEPNRARQSQLESQACVSTHLQRRPRRRALGRRARVHDRTVELIEPRPRTSPRREAPQLSRWRGCRRRYPRTRSAYPLPVSDNQLLPVPARMNAPGPPPLSRRADTGTWRLARSSAERFYASETGPFSARRKSCSSTSLSRRSPRKSGFRCRRSPPKGALLPRGVAPTGMWRAPPPHERTRASPRGEVEVAAATPLSAAPGRA
jgi:hypothetical protein